MTANHKVPISSCLLMPSHWAVLFTGGHMNTLMEGETPRESKHSQHCLRGIRKQASMNLDTELCFMEEETYFKIFKIIF